MSKTAEGIKYFDWVGIQLNVKMFELILKQILK